MNELSKQLGELKEMVLEHVPYDLEHAKKIGAKVRAVDALLPRGWTLTSLSEGCANIETDETEAKAAPYM